ncbi:MAG: spermidine synthase [Mariprofundaceae bacterium]
MNGNPDGRIAIILLFGISFCLLAFEISLLRILTFLQWYHFAYLIISLALLGFAVSGTLLHINRAFWMKHARTVCFAATLSTAVAMALSRQVLAVIPMETFLAIWQPAQILWLAALCLLLFVPFLFGAFLIILILNTAPKRIGAYYAANLFGSGAGSLGGLGLLFLWHPFTIPYVLALLTALLSVLLLPRHRRLIIPSLLGIGLVGFCWLQPSEPLMSSYKPLSRALLMPETQIVDESFGPYGIVHLVESPHLRSAAGLSLSFQGEIPSRPMLYIDGLPAGAVPINRQPSGDAVLKQTIFNLPYHLRNPASVLVLGAGAGAEVQRALSEGALAVTAVEKNPDLFRLPGRFLPDYAGIYRAAGVEAKVEDSRSFLAHTSRQFDLVVLPSRMLAGGSFGMQSLYENYLLTTQSFGRMLEALAPGGLVTAATELDTPARRPLKLFALMAESLRRQGVENAAAHLLAIRNWNWITVLMSAVPFSTRDIDKAKEFASEYGFDMLFPSMAGGEKEATAHHVHADELPEQLAGLVAKPPRDPDTPFHITPPTDERPYFSHFLGLEAAAYMLRTYGAEGFMLQEWGYVLVGVTTIILGLGGFLLVLMPLWLWQRRQAQLLGASSQMGYFAAIGAGFMFIEMLFIQKLVLVLGEPVYAVAGVITAMLIFAGTGSQLSSRVSALSCGAVVWATAGLLLLLALFFVLLPILAPVVAGLATVWRFTAVVALIAPPAIMMGLYFPIGIASLERSGRDMLIPWAWGVNGFVSVISAPLALLIALHYGFTVLAALALLCYAIAARMRPI